MDRERGDLYLVRWIGQKPTWEPVKNLGNIWWMIENWLEREETTQLKNHHMKAMEGKDVLKITFMNQEK